MKEAVLSANEPAELPFRFESCSLATTEFGQPMLEDFRLEVSHIRPPQLHLGSSIACVICVASRTNRRSKPSTDSVLRKA